MDHAGLDAIDIARLRQKDTRARIEEEREEREWGAESMEDSA